MEQKNEREEKEATDKERDRIRENMRTAKVIKEEPLRGSVAEEKTKGKGRK